MNIYVKGVGWFGWMKHLGYALFMEHYSFEFWILVGFESWWYDLGLPKEGRYGEEEDDSKTQFWEKWEEL
jgi:hypothetical protein